MRFDFTHKKIRKTSSEIPPLLSQTAHPAIFTRMDVVGTLTASIDLAKDIRKLVSKYAHASDDYDSSLLFGGELLEVSLRQVQFALRYQRQLGRLSKSDISKVQKAAQKLKTSLSKIEGDLETGKPDTVLRRIRWSLWAGTDIESSLEDVRTNLNAINNIVKLAETNPNIKLLDNFIILKNPGRVLVVNSAVGYKVSAEWKPDNISDGSDTGTLHLDVLVESYASEPRDRVAEIPRVLWWTFEPLNEPASEMPMPFPTGLLPCIGARKHRVMYVLPKNIEPLKTLRQMYYESLSNPERSPVPSVETRYTIAVQAAEALHKVFSAGLLHRAIRSDTLLYIEPKPQDDGSKDQTSSPVNTTPDEQEVVTPEAPKPGLVRRLTDKVRGGGKEAGDRQGRTWTRAEGTGQQRRPPSTTGRRSKESTGMFQSVKRKVSFKREPESEKEENKKMNDEDDEATRKLEPTHHSRPTALARLPRGSLYLIYWNAWVDKFSRIGPIDNEWYTNIYYHPEQQGKRDAEEAYQHRNLGHDIYSLGVCLLEIGLWQAMAVQAWDDRAIDRYENQDAEPPRRTINAQLERELRSQLRAGQSLTRVLKTKEGREILKAGLIALASKELPQRMGAQYAELVKSCLTCLDQPSNSIWKVDFADEKNVARQGKDREAYQAVVLKFLRSIVAAFEAESPFKTGR